MQRKSIKSLDMEHSWWSDHNSMKRLFNLSLRILSSFYRTCYTIQNTSVIRTECCISKIRDLRTCKSVRTDDPDPDHSSDPDHDPDPDQDDPEHKGLTSLT